MVHLDGFLQKKKKNLYEQLAFLKALTKSPTDDVVRRTHPLHCVVPVSMTLASLVSWLVNKLSKLNVSEERLSFVGFY